MKVDKSKSSLIEGKIQGRVRDIMGSLPSISKISRREARAIVARYTAVLEGNFIAWMTSAHIASTSKISCSIIRKNLEEELRDNHPGMLRRFAIAANAAPTN